ALGAAFGAAAAPLGAAFGAGFFGSALLASLFASPLFASLLFVSFLPARPCDGAGEAAAGGAVSGAGSLLISARGQEKSSARPCGGGRAPPRVNTPFASASGSLFDAAGLGEPGSSP